MPGDLPLYRDQLPDVDLDYVTDEAGYRRVMDEVGDGVAALDFETTGLDPATARVRLASIVNDDVEALIDFDRLPGGFSAHARDFNRAAWIVFNAGFEQSWFRHGGAAVTCWDVGHLKRSIQGGGHMSLASMAATDLEIELDKTQQVSNWAAPNLTAEQLVYALDDGVVTWELWKLWRGKADRSHLQCFDLLNDLVLPCEDMKRHGMLLDCDRHARLVEHWEDLATQKAAAVRDLIPEGEVENLNSRQQLSRFFSRILPDDYLALWPLTSKTGDLKFDGDALKLMAHVGRGTPLADALGALREYNTISKYLSSFGETLIRQAEMSPDGRIHARYNIAAARTCRFSSSGPNLQQIPRDRELLGEETSIRRSFIAEQGNELISLDYSGIELRMLALLSGDEQLLHDCLHGDVHLGVGSYWAGRQLDKTIVADKRIREGAKGVSFGIIYGSSGGGLAVTMGTSLDIANRLLTYWQERYPKAFRYRYEMENQAKDTGYIRCVDGGTIYLGKQPDLPKCANYPVQRAALSIMARAIYYHWEDTVDDPRIRLLSTIHDALIDEATKGARAEHAYDLMESAMVRAYLDFFPGAPIDKLVEGGIGPSWGELEEVS